MNAGDGLTRATVWIALSLYTAGEWCAAAPATPEQTRMGRWLNSLGAFFFVLHVALAFHFFHGWSHQAAYAETARQTRQLVGWNWGGGLYCNYVFTIVWLTEVAWSWVAPVRYLTRPSGMTWSVRAIFLFMIANGTVVFGRTPVRWFGLVVCLILVLCWARIVSRISNHQ